MDSQPARPNGTRFSLLRLTRTVRCMQGMTEASPLSQGDPSTALSCRLGNPYKASVRQFPGGDCWVQMLGCLIRQRGPSGEGRFSLGAP